MKRGTSSGVRSASKIVYLSSSDEEEQQDKPNSDLNKAEPKTASIQAAAETPSNSTNSSNLPSDTKSVVQKRRKLRSNIF